MPDTETRNAPRLRGNPVFGSAFEMRRDPLGLLTEMRREHGDFVRFRLGPYRIQLLAHPDHVEHVLLTNPRNYLKDGYEHITFVGNGLIASEGDFWRRQRRIAQPAFHRDRLAGMARTMTDATEKMLDRWKSRPGKASKPLDVDAEMSRLTLEIVGRTLFGSSVEYTGGDGEVGRALQTVLTLGFQHIGRFVPVSLHVPTPSNRRYRAAARTLDAAVRSVVSGRRKGEVQKADLLAMLLAARQEMGEQQLREEVSTMLAAGSETTARALTWTFYLLHQHPWAAEKLREELDRSLGGRTPTAQDLPDLVYTEMVLQESMRLLPPVWGLSRLVAEDDEVGGYEVPRGSRVVLSQYVTHRHPDFWDKPDRFDPERFTPERSAGRPRHAYFPFSGGERQCIGRQFALMEAKLILATVAQNFELFLVPGHPVEPEPSFTLRPRYGMPMTTTEPG